MILFQLDQFNLYKEIENYSYSIIETLDKFVINTNYIDGDRRLHRNRSSKTVLSCSGKVKSQHFLHYLRKLSEKDKGQGDIKAYWIEKYENYNPDFNALSDYKDKKAEQYEVRIYFGYVHIDITAINPFVDEYGNEHFDIKFDLSMFYTSVFEITNSYNGFIVDKLKSKPYYTFDDNETRYDQGGKYIYDKWLTDLQLQQKELYNQKDNLLDFYKKVTCCDNSSYLYIFFVDKIYKPFTRDNFYKDSGKINSSIARDYKFYKDKNFFQTYISNPKLSTTFLKKDVIQYIYKPKDTSIVDNEPFKISNIDNISNTYSKTAIIQLFRMETKLVGGVVTPTNDSKLLPLFEESEGELMEITVTHDFDKLSSIGIYLYDQDLRANLKMLIIHPHNQKVYGIMNDTKMVINNNLTGYQTTNNNLIDLEEYLLDGSLNVINQLYDTQDWFKLSPAYMPRNELNQRRENDLIQFKITYSNGLDTPNTLNTGIFLQIESYTENKLI
jgi:hypothetical protein